MEALKNKLEYKGTLKEFMDMLKTDKRFTPESAESIITQYKDIIKLVTIYFAIYILFIKFCLGNRKSETIFQFSTEGNVN